MTLNVSESHHRVTTGQQEGEKCEAESRVSDVSKLAAPPKEAVASLLRSCLQLPVCCRRLTTRACKAPNPSQGLCMIEWSNVGNTMAAGIVISESLLLLPVVVVMTTTSTLHDGAIMLATSWQQQMCC